MTKPENDQPETGNFGVLLSYSRDRMHVLKENMTEEDAVAYLDDINDKIKGVLEKMDTPHWVCLNSIIINLDSIESIRVLEAVPDEEDDDNDEPTSDEPDYLASVGRIKNVPAGLNTGQVHELATNAREEQSKRAHPTGFEFPADF